MNISKPYAPLPAFAPSLSLATGESPSGALPDEGRADGSVSRSKRDVERPQSTDARATADAEVAKSYAAVLGAGLYKRFGRPPYVNVPEESTLGRWRSQLNSAFKGAGFVAWAREQKLDLRDLIINPSRGELSGYADGVLKTFSPSDDSGWFDVSRTLLSAVKVFAPQSGQEIGLPLAGQDKEMTFDLVAQFYGEPARPNAAQTAARLEQLSKDPSLKLPDNYLPTRSDAALSAQQQALGDDANRHALITALRSQVDDADGSIDLDRVNIPIDPRSGLFASEQRREMSAAQFLKQEGNNVPVNSKQALEVAWTLSFDLARRAPGAESGGVRPLTNVLGAGSLRRMRTVVEGWKKLQEVSSIPTGNGAGSLLRLLINALPESSRKLMTDNPASAMDVLIRSPEALALGNSIQRKLKIIETPTSAIESVSAALVQDLDPLAGKSRYNLAGYNLYGEDNAGASAADIVARFITHLESRVGAEVAPLAARLLLSAVAPELQVSDTSPNLVYGSHTWANFAIEVARIEQQVPGASANMTFSQVMAFGEGPPISAEGEDQLHVAMRAPIIDWGVANGVVKSRSDDDYSDAEISHSLDALNRQQKELAWAKKVLGSLPPTRSELALAELKRVFPDVDPTLKVLQAPWVKHDPVSLIDIYMTGEIVPDRWMSLDNKNFPYDEMKSRLSSLIPDINVPFSNKFEEFKKDHESAWAIMFKYQLSLLPAADREHISQSTVTFFEVSRPFLKKVMVPKGRRFQVEYRPGTPTPAEREALKGRHGLLMKAEGHDGQVSYYSYIPELGKIVKEKGFPGDQTNDNDDAYFGGDTEGRVSGTKNLYQQLGPVDSDRDPPESADNRRGVYFSAKSGALASTTAGFFTRDIYALKNQAAGITELEKGRAYDEKLKEFFLSVVPFYDGVQDAINGNVAGAVLNIGFDILGFFLPGLTASRKAFRAGKGVLNTIKSGVLAGIGASVGFTDSVDIVKNLNKGAARGYKDINKLPGKGREMLSRLKGNYRGYDAIVKYKDGDIVKGFVRYDEGGLWTPLVAIFKKGAWYAYNSVSKAPFGPQILQFGVMSAVEKELPVPETPKKIVPAVS